MAHVHQLCVSIDKMQDDDSEQLMEFKQSKARVKQVRSGSLFMSI